MLTCLDVITRAFQKCKVYGGGETPSDDDTQTALDELQSLYEMWAANGMFGQLSDTLQPTDYKAKPGERIQISNGAAVTLPASLEEDDEAPPYGLSLIEVVDAAAQTVTRHLYEDGQWIEIGALALTDTAPLSSRGAAGLAACLAMLLAEEFGGQVGPMTLRQASAFKTGLALKLGGDSQRTGPDWY